MRKILSLVLLAATILAAQNIIPNASMKELNKDGTPVGWGIFRKGTLRIPGSDDSDFTLGLRDGKDATVTINIKPEPNEAYIFTFEARSATGSLMENYFEWFKSTNGQVDYAGAASTKKQPAPKEWKKFSVPLTVTDDFHHGYVAIRSLNGEPLDIRNLCVRKARTHKDSRTGGFWNLDALNRFSEKGIAVRNGETATLYAIPVEAGKTYMLSYDACGNGPVDPAYPFHEIKTKIFPTVQSANFANDVTNTTQRKTKKFMVPEGSAINHVNIQFTTSTRSNQAEIIFSRFDLKEIIPDPKDKWRLHLTRPFYRDTIFASQHIDTMECQLLSDGTAAFCEVTFNGKAIRKDIHGAHDLRIEIPVKDLADGSYPLMCYVCDGDSNVLKSFAKKVWKVPAAPTEVTCDENRRVRINGKPFMPIGVNLRDWSEDYVRYAAQHGVNWSLMRLGATEEDTLAQMDLAQKYGIMVCFFSGSATGKPGSYKQFRESFLKRFTPAIRRHPAFLMYYMIDEPFWAGKPYEPLQKTYEIYRELDPYHPVWIVDAPRGEVEDLRPYGAACDIYGADVYPVPWPNSHSGLDDKTMTSVGKYSIRMNGITWERKPIMMSLQAFGWGENPENGPQGRAKVHPTYENMRFMLLDAMLNGSTAIEQWGSNHVKNVDYLEIVLNTCRDYQRFSGLFFSGKAMPDAKASDAAIRTSVWECTGNRYYFIMNIQDKTVSGTTDIPATGLKDIMSWGATSQPTADGKALSVTLEPYACMVLGTSDLPAPVYQLYPGTPEPEGKDSPAGRAIQRVLESFTNMKKFETKANWIWQAQKAIVDGDVCFIAKKYTAKPGEKVILKIAVDDASIVYLNGKEIGQTKGWSNLFEFDLTGATKPGENTLMVRAIDGGGKPCGMLAELQVGTVVFLSDTTWLGMPSEKKNSPVPQTLDGFTPATIVQPYGGGAWGNNVLFKIK